MEISDAASLQFYILQQNTIDGPYEKISIRYLHNISW